MPALATSTSAGPPSRPAAAATAASTDSSPRRCRTVRPSRWRGDPRTLPLGAPSPRRESLAGGQPPGAGEKLVRMRVRLLLAVMVGFVLLPAAGGAAANVTHVQLAACGASPLVECGSIRV